MKSAFSVLLLCFLLASCGEEKTVKFESKEAKEMRVRAEAGDTEAQVNLGLMYYNGEGVPEDKSRALEWTRKAAEQGNAVGQYNLGVTYANKFDYEEAVKWFRKAAEQGHAGAKEWFRRSGFEE